MSLPPRSLSRTAPELVALTLAVLLACNGEANDYVGTYDVRVALMGYGASSLANDDCRQPISIHSADGQLSIAHGQDGDFLDFQACRITGEIRDGVFLAENAPCGPVGAAPVYFPKRVYEQVEVDFKAGTINLLFSSLGEGSEGTCVQLEGQVRKVGEPWRVARDQFVKVTGTWTLLAPQYKGIGQVTTYLQTEPDGGLYLVGLSCRLPATSPSGGMGGTSPDGACEDRFHGAHGIPPFVPFSSTYGGKSFSLTGEFVGDQRTYSLEFADAQVTPDDP